MAVALKLTQALVNALTFGQPLIRLDAKGTPVYGKAPKGREWRIRDTEVEGLQVRVTPGAVGWYVRRRMGIHGDQLRCLGSHPGLSLADARKRGRLWLSMMAEGKDPLVEKKKHQAAAKVARAKDSITMAVAYDQFVAGTSEKVSPNTTADREKPKKWMKKSPIWAMPIVDIDREAVAQSLDPLRKHITEGRRRPAWGPKSCGAASLQKCYMYLHSAYRRAARDLGLPFGKDETPFARWRSEVAWPKPKPRETFLPTRKQEGKDWLKALVALAERAHDPALLTRRPDPRKPGLKPHSSVLVDYFLLVTLWGTRKVETARLEWSAVDFENKVVFLEPEKTKARTLAAVPLTAWAVQMLRARKATNERWRPGENSRWVFPSRQHGKPIAEPRSIAETLSRETGLWITPHDLRRTMATEHFQEGGLEQAAKMLVAGAALHHAQGRTGGTITAVTQSYLMEKAEALRPLYQARENRLREIAGLPPLVATATPAQGTTDLVEQAMNDPAFAQAFFARLAGKAS